MTPGTPNNVQDKAENKFTPKETPVNMPVTLTAANAQAPWTVLPNNPRIGCPLRNSVINNVVAIPIPTHHKLIISHSFITATPTRHGMRISEKIEQKACGLLLANHRLRFVYDNQAPKNLVISMPTNTNAKKVPANTLVKNAKNC